MFESAVGLKKRIRDGEQIVGTTLPLDATRERFLRVMDGGPYDFVSADSQHSALNEERLAEFCGIAEELDVFVQFRIKHTRNAYLIGNYLDLGPCGIEVPQTESDKTVAEALGAFYFPPAGIRSYGGRARRGASDFTDPFDYAGWWNAYGVLWLQIESVEAVTRAHLLARTGVDCLSFGPTDLTFSLTAHPNHALKSVDDAVAYVAKSLQGSGVAVCHRTGAAEQRSKYLDMGVTVILEPPPV
ncbi:MAG: aldolase/citrate lyase family protein [Gemmatimonadota bacterium]|nr:aldolase/citrate lyase family protein [Gemmatimonadota bacterium]